jgi:hypothetical protein
MNLRIVRWFVPIALTCALLTVGRTSARAQTAKHHHYKFIDLGTFGGPKSGVNGEPSVQVINNAGTVVGVADTPMLTPVPGGFNPIGRMDFFISHAFVWRGGSLKDLGTNQIGRQTLAGVS